jgi:glycosyltransferase involved in cell wall biosynthesis
MATPSAHQVQVAVSLPTLAAGGAETVMLRIAGGIAARAIATDLVLARAEGQLRDRVPAGVRAIDLGARRPLVIGKTIGLARYLARVRPGVLVSALDVVNAAAVARALSRAPTRLILSIHTNLTEQFADKPDLGIARVRRTLVRALYDRADAIVAVSQGVADDAARIAGLDPQRVTVIPNPIVTPELALRAQEPVSHRFFDDSTPVVLGVGRLVRQKDFATLLRAFHAVRKRHDARLVILGPADPRESRTAADLRALASELGVDDDVDFPGWVPNPAAYMARADVLALSSIYEGFGNVIAEALAVGTPVVATDCPSGPAEILDHGRYGRLVPVGDHEALGAAILGTLAARREPAALRARAARYRTEQIVDEYLAVLDGV